MTAIAPAVDGFVGRVRGRYGPGPAGEDPALAPAAGAEPDGTVGAASRDVTDAVTAGLSGHDTSAVVADMRSPARTLGTKETRGR